MCLRHLHFSGQIGICNSDAILRNSDAILRNSDAIPKSVLSGFGFQLLTSAFGQEPCKLSIICIFSRGFAIVLAGSYILAGFGCHMSDLRFDSCATLTSGLELLSTNCGSTPANTMELEARIAAPLAAHIEILPDCSKVKKNAFPTPHILRHHGLGLMR